MAPDADRRFDRAKRATGVLFVIAIVGNTVDVIWSPTAPWWSQLRYAVSILFLISLVTVAVLWFSRRRARPATGQSTR